MLGGIEGPGASPATGVLFFFFAIAVNDYIYSQRRMEREARCLTFSRPASQIFLFSDDEPKPPPLLIGWAST